MINRRFAGFPELVDASTSWLNEQAERAISSSGSFMLAVSGGSIVTDILQPSLPRLHQPASWRWCLVDERHVPVDHPESNYKLVSHALCASSNGIPLEYNSDAETMAEGYSLQLEACLKAADKDKPDAAFMGMGPDGHIASLFPGHPWTDGGGDGKWFMVIRDAPKAPPCRVSMPMERVQLIDNVLVAAWGPQKQDAIRKVIEGDTGVPLTTLSHFTLYHAP